MRRFRPRSSRSIVLAALGSGGLFLLMGALLFGLTAAITDWMIEYIPPEAVEKALRQSAAGSPVYSRQWMESGMGLPGVRYLFERVTGTWPVCLFFWGGIALAGIGASGCAIWFRNLQKEKRRLAARIRQPLELPLPEQRICAASAQSSEFSKPSPAEKPPHSFTVPFETNSLKELEQALVWRRKQEKRLLAFQNDLLNDGKERYENVLHQLCSRQTSLHFSIHLMECILKQQTENKQNDRDCSISGLEPREEQVLLKAEELNEQIELIKEVLEECDLLVRHGLRQAVYKGCRLDALVQLCLDERKDQFKNKGVQAECTLPAMKLVGDSLWLLQVFETVIANALEEAPGGSCLRISGFDETDQFRIIIENESDHSADADHLLERYHTTSETHFGIGLDLAAKTMNRHQGRLEIETPPGFFRILLIFPCSALERSVL